MAEFTKEQLIEQAKWVRANLTPLIKSAEADHAETMSKNDRLMEIALAALTAGMEQEPVALKIECWSCKREVEASAVRDCDGYCPECDSPIDLDDEPAYAAPQLPQPAVMDDEQSKRLFDKWSGGDAALGELRSNGVPDEFISMLKGFSMASWEACRAAMLQGAEPVSQPYTLRGGWVAVPVEPTAEMIEATFVGEMELQSVQHQIRNRERRAQYYRAMIAAAPQQEVK